MHEKLTTLKQNNHTYTCIKNQQLSICAWHGLRDRGHIRCIIIFGKDVLPVHVVILVPQYMSHELTWQHTWMRASSCSDLASGSWPLHVAWRHIDLYIRSHMHRIIIPTLQPGHLSKKARILWWYGMSLYDKQSWLMHTLSNVQLSTWPPWCQNQASGVSDQQNGIETIIHTHTKLMNHL